jgi:transposase
MKELDGRKISRKALEEIRIRAVNRVEAGEHPEVVSKALGFSRPRIYEWHAKYREGGIAALRSRKEPGKVPKLRGEDLKKIYRLVVGKDLRMLQFCLSRLLPPPPKDTPVKLSGMPEATT